jgi:hypothetical protein
VLEGVPAGLTTTDPPVAVEKQVPVVTAVHVIPLGLVAIRLVPAPVATNHELECDHAMPFTCQGSAALASMGRD